jgi:hypothetical protein
MNDFLTVHLVLLVLARLRVEVRDVTAHLLLIGDFSVHPFVRGHLTAS